MSSPERYRGTESAFDVGFVFGVLSASALSGPVLIDLLGGLGVSESAARNTLTRMLRMGSLTAVRVGRVSVYTMTDQPARKYRQVEGTAGGPGWDGAFRCIVYDVPERERNFRDRLRYLAAFNGYGPLRPGVLISPREHSRDLDGVIAARPEGTRIHCAQLRPADLAEARRMAAEAWDLDGIAQWYHRVIAAVAGERAAGPGADLGTDPWLTFRRLRRLYRAVLDLQLADPDLPPELLPRPWPRTDYQAGLDALNRAWGPRLCPALREVADRADRTASSRYYPPPWATPRGTAAPQP